jgi:hypothetical protein
MRIEQTKCRGKLKSNVSNYRPRAPQRAHGEMVGGVMALWQLLVRREVDLRPTNRKALMAPELQKERTDEKGRLLGITLQHPPCTAPCMCWEEQHSPTDLGTASKSASVILQA